jgi:Resolvase, N terminal domain/HNH endonuclease
VWADTTTPHGKLMLTILGDLAEFERDLIRARTGEGRARTKANGVKLGRPNMLDHHQRREAIERLSADEAVIDVPRTFGVNRATLYRLASNAKEGARIWQNLASYAFGFLCSCGFRGKGLNHHHIVPLEEGGTDDEDNIITLCRKHHGQIHGAKWSTNWYGRLAPSCSARHEVRKGDR